MNHNSDLYTTKSLESLNSILKIPKPHYYKNITSSLLTARSKLLPIINEILKTSEHPLKISNQPTDSYRITLDQYNDVIGALQLLKEVDGALRKNSSKTQFNKLFKQPNFNIDSKIKINKSGKIYIDDSVLNQLIDLHNLLGDIIYFMQEFPQEKHQLLDSNEEMAEFKLETVSSDSLNENQPIGVEKITKEILTCLTLPLNTDFTVMTSSTNAHEENQRSKTNLEQERRRSSLKNNINAAGARKIIIKCIADLDKVINFLEKDFSIDIEKSKSQTLHPEHVSIQSVHSLLTENTLKNPKNACCCLENCPVDQPLEFTWKENGETGSKLVICIKGKTEEDGDIHVVIRQCPECLNSKKEETGVDSNEDPTVETEPVHDKEPPVQQTPRNSTEKRLSDLSNKPSSKHSTSESSRIIQEEIVNRPYSDTVYKTTNDQDDTNQQNINVIFDPENPSHSVVEGPNIRINDTINLNLMAGECNQDLVISLSVKPKGTKSKHILNIDDIFNDSQASISKSKTSLQRPDRSEKVYPIFRTKICSSMEIDVDVVRSKLHTVGLQHQNREIQTKLNDIGVHNILRASRPVKCGRMAVLDEYSHKNLPYAPSLRSLPLKNDDIQLVNQSLNMSVNKIKQSGIYVEAKENRKKNAYFMHIFKQNVKFFNSIEVKKIWIYRKLNYYIHLQKHVY